MTPQKRKSIVTAEAVSKKRKEGSGNTLAALPKASRQAIFERQLSALLLDSVPPWPAVRTLSVQHRLPKGTRSNLIGLLKKHTCTEQCFFPKELLPGGERHEPMRVAGVEYWAGETIDVDQKTKATQYILTHRVPTIDTLRPLSMEHGCYSDSIAAFSVLYIALQGHTCDETCLIRKNVWEEFLSAHPPVLRAPSKTTFNKANRARLRAEFEESERRDKAFWAENWPILLEDSELQKMLRESAFETQPEQLHEYSCSFCGVKVRKKWVKRNPIQSIDITVLEDNRDRLQELYPQSRVEVAKLFGDEYMSCKSCWKCVRRDRSTGTFYFAKVPLLSWANGCWLGGDRPRQLDGLTLVEEMAIAKARGTPCWFKLRATAGPGTAQRASSGNVCFHPQDITEITRHLPRPINILCDDIAVSFVHTSETVTATSYQKTPLIARRSRILEALLWLKEHNPFYSDIIIDTQALAEYSEDGVIPLTAVDQVLNDTIHAESTTYTGTSQHDIVGPPDQDIPLYASGTGDVNKAEVVLQVSKLEAIQHVKNGGSFLKIATGSDTIWARDEPHVYAYLWPTLFPYGCGFMEDPVRRGEGFSQVQFHSHVRYLLKLRDQRFQLHKSFMFVVHNLMLRKKSSYQAKMAVSRRWWPDAIRILNNVTSEALTRMRRTLLQRQAAKDHSPYTPANEEEEDIMKLLRYVNTVSSHIPGSAADVGIMREELRAIARAKGTPSLFFTLNPADAHHPLVSFYAGKDINIDKAFPHVDSRYTTFDRARTLADDPVAGARFFHATVNRFLDIFLGMKRKSRRGVFGRVKSYYGVVESQNRGSLHIHLLIWLEGALSPKSIVSRCNSDTQFRERMFTWLESICKLSLPNDTTFDMPVRDFTEEERKAAILSMHPSPKDEEFASIRNQFLREVLENSAQRHSHGDTCFKHMTRSCNSMTAQERDFHCRFNLPTEIVVETHMDEDGKIHLKREDPYVVGYNPTVSFAFGCNTDCKFIGSGYLGMAMSIYITNYTAKTTLDSATVMTAMTGVLLANQQEKGASSTATPHHSLVMKTLNQMVGRREMSAQQVASALLSLPNRYTNERFNRVYWTSTLRWLSPSLYGMPLPTEASNEDPRPSGTNGFNAHTDDDLVIITPGVSVSEADIPPPRSAAYDMLYRPAGLADLCWWELLSLYEKVSMKSKIKSHEEEDEDDAEDDAEEDDPNDDDEEELEGGDENEQQKGTATMEKRPILAFQSGHPQQETHGLRIRKEAAIPVLIGASIPRRDMSVDGEKYAMTMLALFKPWASTTGDPLRSHDGQTWMEAFSEWLPSANEVAHTLMDRFEEQWECRSAADDFSRQRREKFGNRPSHFASELAVVNNEADDDDDGKLEKTVVFTLSQTDMSDEAPISELPLQFSQTMRRLTAKGLAKIVNLSTQANIYDIGETINCEGQALASTHSVREGDRTSADQAACKLADERARVQALRGEDERASSDRSTAPTASTRLNALAPYTILTTIREEMAIIERRLAAESSQRVTRWRSIHEWKRLAIAVIRHFTLNKQQKMAFVCIVNNRIEALECREPIPFRFIIGGPGGAGKSHIYAAIKAWYTCISHLEELAFVAPTGIAADNIDGATIHSFFGLQWNAKSFNVKQKEALRQRLLFVKLIIVDECYFVGCRQFGKMSKHVNLALNMLGSSFGGLDVVVAGDEYQLAGPNDQPLYTSTFAQINERHSTVQGQNDQVKDNLHGFLVYREFKDCIVLRDVVRQKNRRYAQLLNRLRHGVCTEHGPDNDVSFLNGFRLSSLKMDDDLKCWISNPAAAAPLVTYTNAVRDMHNWNMTKAFCDATAQPFHIYHSEDFLAGKNKMLLTGLNARHAWSTPIKGEANDLTGRLALAIRMPVIIVHNMATELGICNGTRGILQGVKYFERDGKRFTVSVDVEIERYKGEGSKIVTIPAITQSMTYSIDGYTFNCKRTQVPVIAGFAFTIHNSQSQSLNAMIAHLESSSSTAASYVLLSRIKCEREGPINLRIIGDIPTKKITNHASEQVRSEELRLLRLEEETMKRLEESCAWMNEYDVSFTTVLPTEG